MDWFLYDWDLRHYRFRGILRRYIEHFLKKRIYEKLGISAVK